MATVAKNGANLVPLRRSLVLSQQRLIGIPRQVHLGPKENCRLHLTTVGCEAGLPSDLDEQTALVLRRVGPTRYNRSERILAQGENEQIRQ